MKHTNRKRSGEFSPPSSKPKATAIGSLKSPKSFKPSNKHNSKGFHLKSMERKKPLSIKKSKEEFGE